MLISEAFEDYRRNVVVMKNLSPKTEEQYRYALNSIVRSLGNVDIENLTLEDIREWREKSLKHCSQITLRNYIVCLRCVLLYLSRTGVPCVSYELITVPKRERKVPKVICPEDVERLIESCGCKGMSAERSARNKLIFSLLYASGIRVSELVALNRSDLRDGRFTVVGKGGKPRLCFYDDRTNLLLAEYLRLRKDGLPALFVTYGTTLSRMSPGDVRKTFRNAGRRTGIEGLHPHTLRHSYATSLMSAGMHIYTLSRLMGHSSIQTTQQYLHVTDPILQEEYQRYHTV